MARIDLNSDVGESYGVYRLGDDAAIFDHVTSANIACGFHAGDPQVMDATVRLAVARGVAVGAHPGYPDLMGFGRREMQLSPEEVEACVLYQVGALAGFARAHGVDLQHVKPHGALYNVAARDPRTALAIARAVARFSKDLVLVGLAGSALVAAGREMGLPVAEEVFADRRYEPDGSLRSRRLPDAVLHDPQQAAAQALRLAQEGAVVASTGEVVRVRADTICLHGDTPGAVAIAQAVAAALRAAGVELVPVGALVRR